MYIDNKSKDLIFKGTPELERDICMECGKEPVIIWKPAVWGTILLCGECSQLIGTQLIKDVRSFELDSGLSVKVKTEVIRK